MIGVIRKFFRFCPETYRKKFYQSIGLGILMAAFRAMRIPAIALILGGVLDGNVTVGQILAGFFLLLAGVVMEGLLRGKITMLQTEAGYGTATDKRIEIAEHMRYLPMGYFSRNSLGEITSVATNTMESLQNVATRVIMLVSEGILTTALIAVAVLIFDWRIGLVLLAGCCIYFFCNRLMQKRSEEMSPVKIHSDTELVDHVLDYIQGIREVKAYGLAGEKTESLNRAIEENVDANTGMEMALVPFMTIQSIVTKAAGVLMSILSIRFFLDGSMDLLTCIMMVICAFMVFGSLETAGNYSGLLRVVDLCVDRADEILSIPAMEISGEEIVPRTHTMEADSIYFSYGNEIRGNDPVSGFSGNSKDGLTKGQSSDGNAGRKGRWALEGVIARIPEQSVTALVGPSGSGKTTFVSLLARFWDVERGTVRMDGKDVRDYSMDALMKNFSFVFQRVYLFRDTVANNIRFGRQEASMDEVIRAAKKAQCHDFIMALPDGYETVIGENGANLSGGERQRISIARAMMKDSPVIVLDEATANVDPENEMELMKAIRELTAEKTVVMIAHRLETVRGADQILVLDQGKIVQRGTHKELMREEGIYQNFIRAREFAAGWRL